MGLEGEEGVGGGGGGGVGRWGRVWEELGGVLWVGLLVVALTHITNNNGWSRLINNALFVETSHPIFFLVLFLCILQNHPLELKKIKPI